MGAKPSFKSYEIELGYSQTQYFDFDGNGFGDIIAIDGINGKNLIVFFQDAQKGFSKTSDLVYSFENTPALIWPAKLKGNAGQSILVMTKEGVSTLTYTDKKQAPKINKIIDRQTIIAGSDDKDYAPVNFFTLSAKTTNENPLIFVPTEECVEVWSYDKQWQRAYSMQNIFDNKVYISGTGYTKTQLLEMNIGDLNGDTLDDLIVSRRSNAEKVFDIYYQNNKGYFGLSASKSFDPYEWGWQKWACIQDINRDGHADIIKNDWLQEPGFIPGADSGKVVVEIFLADQNGNIPENAQYIFRKSDWTPSMPIVDIDNDGHIDLVFGYGQFDTREGLRKAITSKKLDHTLRFHFYNRHGYDQEPNFETKISVYLDYRGPIFSSRNGRVERRISLDGDFNGDGFKDLLVTDKEDKCSVYFFKSRKEGFSRKSDLHFNTVNGGKDPIVTQLNNDGISDLIIWNRKKGSHTIFLSQQ